MLNRLLRSVLNRRRHQGDEIHPEDIFLDNYNLPKFDRHQMEGRIERPISVRVIVTLGVVFICIGLVLSGRVFALQVMDGEVFAAQSESNRLRQSLLFSERGVVYDTHRTELAWNQPAQEGEDFITRRYATSSGIAHLVGYLSYPQKDTSGVYYQESYEGRRGIEKTFDSRLAGTNGVRIIEIDATNNVLSQHTIRRPRDGQNLQLAIDIDIQEQLYDYIKQRAQDSGFEGGAGIIMDIKTGELVALTSYPEYDPQAMTDGDDEKIKRLQEQLHTPFLNRAVGGLFTPGSIVKPYLALAALDQGIIDPETTIESTGTLEVPNPYDPDNPTLFYDWKAHGRVDMREALAVSSNVYFYQIGGGYEDQEGLGITNIQKYLGMFGFGQTTDIKLDGEKEGTIPGPEWKRNTFAGDIWRLGDTYNTAIGQFGVQVTPIQTVRAVAALANGGHLITPRLERSSEDQTGDGKEIDVDARHFDIVREGMRQAVTDGTAAGLDVPYLDVAAKTGTAEIGTMGVNSWVTGYYPYEDPRYAFTVVMERGPRKNTLGGVWVMRNMFDWIQRNKPAHFQK